MKDLSYSQILALRIDCSFIKSNSKFESVYGLKIEKGNEKLEIFSRKWLLLFLKLQNSNFCSKIFEHRQKKKSKSRTHKNKLEK